MDAQDILELGSLLAGLLFLIIGERLKDNIYRTLSGVSVFAATFDHDFPVLLRVGAYIFTLYMLSMWMFQPFVRAPTAEKAPRGG